MYFQPESATSLTKDIIIARNSSYALWSNAAAYSIKAVLSEHVES